MVASHEQIPVYTLLQQLPICIDVVVLVFHKSMEKYLSIDSVEINVVNLELHTLFQLQFL